VDGEHGRWSLRVEQNSRKESGDRHALSKRFLSHQVFRLGTVPGQYNAIGSSGGFAAKKVGNLVWRAF
jgi:hypothetical protein